VLKFNMNNRYCFNNDVLILNQCEFILEFSIHGVIKILFLLFLSYLYSFKRMLHPHLLCLSYICKTAKTDACRERAEKATVITKKNFHHLKRRILSVKYSFYFFDITKKVIQLCKTQK